MFWRAQVTEATEAFGVVFQVFKHGTTVLENAEIIEQTQDIALRNMNLFASVYRIINGCKRIFYNGLFNQVLWLKRRLSTSNEYAQHESISMLFQRQFEGGKAAIVSGGLLLGSGICGVLESLEVYRLLPLGFGFSALQLGARLAMLSAAAVFLYDNTLQYWQARSLPDSPLAPGLGKNLCYSAVLGILSTLAYVFSLFAAWGGLPFAVIIVFGFLSSVTGFLQVIVDWLRQWNGDMVFSV